MIKLGGNVLGFLIFLAAVASPAASSPSGASGEPARSPLETALIERFDLPGLDPWSKAIIAKAEMRIIERTGTPFEDLAWPLRSIVLKRVHERIAAGPSEPDMKGH